MKKLLMKKAMSTLLLAGFIGSSAYADDVVCNGPTAQQEKLDNLLTAIIEGDYKAFANEGNDTFKETNTLPRFTQFSKLVGPLMKKGHKTCYFGDLEKEANQIYVWKLSFDEAPDDGLIALGFNEVQELSSMAFQ